MYFLVSSYVVNLEAFFCQISRQITAELFSSLLLLDVLTETLSYVRLSLLRRL